MTPDGAPSQAGPARGWGRPILRAGAAEDHPRSRVHVRDVPPYDGLMPEIDETPDPTRPRNVWPRLLVFAGALAVGLTLFGACAAAYVRSVPARELTVSLQGIEPGRPRLLPVTVWGADRDGFTFGAWVVVLEGREPRAYLSRDPSSGCQVQWQLVTVQGRAQGLFVDRCGGGLYGLDGAPLAGSEARGLDRFAVRARAGELIVSLARVELGACAREGQSACSGPGAARSISLPAAPLAGVEALRR